MIHWRMQFVDAGIRRPGAQSDRPGASRGSVPHRADVEIEFHEVVNKINENVKLKPSGIVEMFDSNDKKICTSKTFTMD